MDTKLLSKYIANRCSSDEVIKILSWITKRPNGLDESLLKSHWDSIEEEECVDDEISRRKLAKIHHTINLNQSARERERKVRFLKRDWSPIKRLLLRGAAILLIPVLTILVYNQFLEVYSNEKLIVQQEYEIISPAGSLIHFKLPDGTEVWLNRKSKLVYPSQFTGHTRTVHLVGEGYFDVKTNKEKPFVVESRGMSVKALGTSFNVKAYPEDPLLETTLETGEVVVLGESNNRKLEICKMKPGQHFSLNSETRKYSLKTENTAKRVSWKLGILTFEDDPLDQVAKRLSRWYNVKVTLNDPELSSLTYTATFIDESLYQVLEMLEIVTPISISISDRKKLPDGTFSDKEIIIYKKKEGKLTIKN